MQVGLPGRWLGSGALVLAVLVACGGGDSPYDSGPVTIQGTVIDGQADGSRVYLDLNNNQQADAGEPMSAELDASGTFTLQAGALTRADLANAMLVVETRDGARGRGYKAFAPAAAFVHTDDEGRHRTSRAVISPLTTLVGAEVSWNGLTPEQAVDAVRRQLDLGASDPMSDYVAHPDAKLQALAHGTAGALADLRARGTPEGESHAMHVAHVKHTLVATNTSAAAAGKFAPQSADVPAARPADKINFIVRLRQDITDPGAHGQQVASAHGGVVNSVFSRVIKGFALSVPSANSASFLDSMQQDPSVLHVEVDKPVHALQASQSGATWGIDRSDQRYLPLDQTYTYGATGSGVTAYVIDTGIRATHSDFGGRVQPGFTAIFDGNGTNDCNGHGTHVSGTIAGSTWGMAKGANIVPVRVLDCFGSGSASTVIAGLDWVAWMAANGPRPAVVNMSLGGGASPSVDDAVANVVAQGITVVVAAGNWADNACNYSPARAPAALAVAASTALDARASFSNYGSCVGVFAPGDQITSASNESDTATAVHSGTSMASPHVAGLAALYLQTHTGAAPAEVIGAIKNAATIGQIADAGPSSPTTLIYTDLTSTSPIPPPPISSPPPPISSPPPPISSPPPPISSPPPPISSPPPPVSSPPPPISSPPPPPPPPAPSVSVGALTGSAAVVKKGWQAGATIVIQNESSALVAGALVKGVYSNAPRTTLSCTTAPNGSCVIKSAILGAKVAAVQFTVTGVTSTGRPYNPSLNARTSISIAKPN